MESREPFGFRRMRTRWRRSKAGAGTGWLRAALTFPLELLGELAGVNANAGETVQHGFAVPAIGG